MRGHLKATKSRIKTRRRNAPHDTIMAMTATPRPSTFSGGGLALTVNKVSRLIVTSLPRASVWTALQENLDGKMENMSLSIKGKKLGPSLKCKTWKVFSSRKILQLNCSTKFSRTIQMEKLNS